jgi:hypothetical protein
MLCRSCKEGVAYVASLGKREKVSHDDDYIDKRGRTLDIDTKGGGIVGVFCDTERPWCLFGVDMHLFKDTSLGIRGDFDGHDPRTASGCGDADVWMGPAMIE